MEKKPGWTYIYSELLKQHIALHQESGWVYCEDGTKYSPREVNMLHDIYGDKPIPLSVHTLKKVFGGELQESQVAGARAKPAKPAATKTEKPPPTSKPAELIESAQNVSASEELEIY